MESNEHEPGNRRGRERLQLIVASGIFVVWITAFLAGLIRPGYSPPITIHAAFGVVIGWLFKDAARELFHRQQEPK